MDLQYFFNVLLRRKWLLLSVATIAAIATFVLVTFMPFKFKSDATLEANLLGDQVLDILQNNDYTPQWKADARYNKFIENMKRKQITRLLIEELLHHDLTSDKPFRQPAKPEELPYSQEELRDFAAVLTSTKDTVSGFGIEKHNNIKFSELAEAYGYDHEELLKNLTVTRVGDTDFISVNFTSESPDLSYFVVHKYCDEFLAYYDKMLVDSEDEGVATYREIKEEKGRELEYRKEVLNEHRRTQSIVDMEKQSGSVITQIAELETAIEEERQDIRSQREAIAKLTYEIRKIAPEQADNQSNTLFNNEDLERLRRDITRLQSKWIDGGMKDDKLKMKIEKLKIDRKDLAFKIAGNNVIDDKEKSKHLRDLNDQKLQAEIAKASAEEAVQSFEREIARLRGSQNELVLDDARFGELSQEYQIALDAYSAADRDYNQARHDARSGENPLKLVQAAEISEKAEPKNRAILSAFAGTAAGTLMTVFLFLLAFFDKSLQTPSQFFKQSGLPVLGYVNKIKAKQLDLDAIFRTATTDSKTTHFKESIRKLRWALQNSGGTNFLFTSTKPQEGKSFLLLTLAYSLSLNNLRVLIIDANFKNNSLTSMANVPVEMNPFMQSNRVASGTGSQVEAGKFNLQNVDILGNSGDGRSASEVLAGKNFRQILRNYELEYDYILIETAAMNDYSDARELSAFVDKVVLVASAESNGESADKDSYALLRSLGERFYGSVLNNVDLKNL